jgi:DNA repair protein RecO (recombination protein O)
MNRIVTRGIILARVDYGEADRILTVLTPDHGKLRLLAKGVRRVKSKLAGGIELFSVSEITFVRGRGEIGTLVSARLLKHYARIPLDLDRTMAGYELIKRLSRLTEDEPEEAYFGLMQQAFEALDDAAVPLDIINFWFEAQALRLGGHTPNLTHDEHGAKLEADKRYNFDFDDVSFAPDERGRFGAGHIKYLRLAFSGASAHMLARVAGSAGLTAEAAPLVHTMLRTYLRV